MKILVYGAGVLGSLHAARLHEAGHDVTLVARGERLAFLRSHGVALASGKSVEVTHVPVPVTERATGSWDLITVFVRSHQVEALLPSIAELEGDTLFLLNWAAGPAPLEEAIGRDRVLLGFPAQGGTMDGDVVRFRPTSALTRLVRMPIAEPSGPVTSRLRRIAQTFRSAGFQSSYQTQMDAWLKTHAAFEVPLGLAVHTAGGPELLAGDAIAVRHMVRAIRGSLNALPGRVVPRAFDALRVLPESALVPVFTRFLRSTAAAPLTTDTAAVAGELDLLGKQLLSLRGPQFRGPQ
jgi:2-dehydropantoate 2-reductase